MSPFIDNPESGLPLISVPTDTKAYSFAVFFAVKGPQHVAMFVGSFSVP